MKATEAVRQVLKEAGEFRHFFDLSDGERINWLIAKGYELGRTAMCPVAASHQRVGRKKMRPKVPN